VPSMFINCTEKATVKITFRGRPTTLAKIKAAIEREPRNWRSLNTVSGYLQRLVEADMKRRADDEAVRQSDKPTAKGPTNGVRRRKVRQK